MNPDSSVGGVALAPGQLVLIHNTSPQSRATLQLSTSVDGLAWKPLHTLESGTEADEYSYPAMTWVDGSLWLSYTVDRQRLAWQRFTPASGAQPASPSKGGAP